MNRKIKTLFLTDGSYDHASSRIRAVLYFNLLIDALHLNITWIPRIPVKHKNILYKIGIFPILKRWYLLRQLSAIIFQKYELVFIQRFFLSGVFLNLLKRRNTVIIYDFDDAIFLDKSGSNSNYKKCTTMLKAADHIIISTKELEAFCHNQGFYKTSIITTPIDVERFKPKQVTTHVPVIVGWIGSPHTSSFLKNIQESLSEVSKSTPIKLLVIGASDNFNLEGVEVELHPWKYNEEPALLGRMDIGIMPLPNEKYAKGKGGYKLFQYMAAGIPVIASPVGINSEIVKHGVNGFLAHDHKDWVNYITLLSNDANLRSQIGMIGRKEAIEKYSRHVCFEKLSQILKKEISWELMNT